MQTTATDPYVTAQAVWNNRFLTDARSRLVLQVLALAAACSAVISAAAVWYVLHQQQVITVVAEVDGNQVKRTYLTTAETVTLPRQDLVRSELLQWLDDVRALTGNRKHKDERYDVANAKMTAGVNATVRAYFNETHPEVRLQTKTVTVTHSSALPQEGQVWHLEWQEEETETANPTSPLITTWWAILTVELQLSNNPEQRLKNPLGVVITNLSWRQKQGEKQ